MPDRIYTPEIFDEAQIVSGVQPVDELLAERHALVCANATRAALYGPGNVWDASRKSRWAVARLRIKGELVNAGEKWSEAGLDALAYADQKYVDWLAWSEEDKAEYEMERDRIDAITERIRRGALVMKAYTYEPKT
jgi:hypothetical protein